MPLALFGLDGGVGLIVNLLILFLIVVYLALIYWTYLDARRRIEDPVLIACATLASVFPYLGTIVYTILRPPEFLEDREERELELRAAELELRQRIENSCPHAVPVGAPALPFERACRPASGKPLDPVGITRRDGGAEQRPAATAARRPRQRTARPQRDDEAERDEANEVTKTGRRSDWPAQTRRSQRARQGAGRSTSSR
jgi:hypothetical protein